MRYNRNKVVLDIVNHQKETNGKTLYVFNIFTGKIIRRDLFKDKPTTFNDLNEFVDCLSWFMLHNLWYLNTTTYPIFEDNKYFGMKTITKGVLSVGEINRIFKHIDYDKYIENHNLRYDTNIIKV